MISVDEALSIVQNAAVPLPPQAIAVEDALHYTLAQDIVADRPFPPYNRVAMDGYAVKSSDFSDTFARLKVVNKVGAGENFTGELLAGAAIKIMTGAPCPKGADAVVKVENSEEDGDFIKLSEPDIRPGLNLAKKGEDTPAGKILLTKGTQLSAASIAVCASTGHAAVQVYPKPTLRVISTGTEIVSPAESPLDHQIRDCNSYSVRSLSQGLGVKAEFLGIGKDDKTVLSDLIQKGLEADILILSGGVSMGEFDYIPELLAKAGVKQLIHKICVKPGKPVWFGKTDDGTYVFGLPGNPVSVQVAFKLFAETLIKKLSGSPSPAPSFLQLPLAEKITNRNGREYYIPARFDIKDGRTVISPVHIKGSGDFSNLAQSQGLICCPIDAISIEAGSIINFLPWGLV